MEGTKKTTAAKKTALKETAKDTVKKVEKAAEPVAKKVEKAVEPVAKKVEEAAVPAAKAAAKAKTVVKKTAAKAATSARAAKKEVEATVSVQFSGKSYTTQELVAIAKDVWKYDLKQKVSDLKSVELYVKPEENQAYYVINGEHTGSFFI